MDPRVFSYVRNGIVVDLRRSPKCLWFRGAKKLLEHLIRHYRHYHSVSFDAFFLELDRFDEEKLVWGNDGPRLQASGFIRQCKNLLSTMINTSTCGCEKWSVTHQTLEAESRSCKSSSTFVFKKLIYKFYFSVSIFWCLNRTSPPPKDHVS